MDCWAWGRRAVAVAAAAAVLAASVDKEVEAMAGLRIAGRLVLLVMGATMWFLFTEDMAAMMLAVLVTVIDVRFDWST